MDDRREVVISGVGVTTPIGIGRDAFWESLCAGNSGIRRLERFDSSSHPVRIGGEIAGFEGKEYIKPRKSIKVMCRETQLAYTAAALAAQDANLENADADPDRVGVVMGSEILYGDLDELAHAYRSCIPNGRFEFEQWGERAMSDLSPLWMLKCLPNMVACHIGIAQDARAHNNTITAAEASSLIAIAEAAEIIRRGWADVMFAGGVGNRLRQTAVLYRGDRLSSHRNEDPAGASRPFDAGRDGIVNAEGAGVFILETRALAEARGATILARILGFGNRFEPLVNGRAATGSTIRNSIQVALRSAGLESGEIGHVNAHGLATPQDDKVEALAIRDSLGDVPVTAPKSYFGHMGAGSGAGELAVSVLALANGIVPPTLNYTQPDPQCPINVIHGEALPAQPNTALVLNQTRSGRSVAMVLGGAD